MNKMKFMVLFMSIAMIFGSCGSMNNTGKGAAIGGGSGEVNRLVFWVTGSEKSPPWGDTAPITDTEPSWPQRVWTRPARS